MLKRYMLNQQDLLRVEIGIMVIFCVELSHLKPYLTRYIRPKPLVLAKKMKIEHLQH